MKSPITIRNHISLAGLFVLFAVAFVWLSVINPGDRPVLAETKLSDLQAVVLILAVVIPYIAIWAVGLIGYIHLGEYVKLIKKTEEGRPLRMVAGGIFGVLVSLPISSLITSGAQVLGKQHANQALQLRRVGTYLGIVILLWAFYLLMQGSRKMVESMGRPIRPLPRVAVVSYVLLVGLYIYFVLTNPLFENGPVNGHLPPWIVIDTIVLPRLLAWYWGIVAAWHLYQYAHMVPGRIYRLAFSYLAVGVGVVTLSIILLQYVQAISVVTMLPLGAIVLLVYFILIIISAGFMLLARGGRELAKIEKV
ncbi:hypothetical protein BH09PAT4_BH09PAT4_01550 [soil metagenome]